MLIQFFFPLCIALQKITIGLSLLYKSFPGAFQFVVHRPLLFDPTDPLDAELLADTEIQAPSFKLTCQDKTLQA